jgi:hypothetical protein
MNKKFIIYKKPENSGRPRIGKEPREHCSIRMEPRFKNAIIKKYGSVQKWIDSLLTSKDKVA